MNRGVLKPALLMFFMVLIAISTGNAAQSFLPPGEVAMEENFSLRQPVQVDGLSMKEQAWSVRYETSAIFAGITAVGINNWAWGSSTQFHFNSEGWFGEETGSGGADKLGHAYSSYLITELLSDSIRARNRNPAKGPLTAFLITMGLMTYVEFFDGYSDDHGFAYQDMIMNLGGAGFSCLRQYSGALREKVDFRMEYIPSGYGGTFKPFSDYSGQRYLLALKLSGFELFKETPLRFLELHGGYYTRGFMESEAQAGHDRQRTLFAGIGLNLGELLFGEEDTKVNTVGRFVVEHVQVPGTSYTFDEKNL